MVWLFQQIWLWVVLSAVLGFVITLPAVLRRTSSATLRPVPDVEIEPLELTDEPDDVDIEPLDVGPRHR